MTMSTLPRNIPRCRFIKPDGNRCGSPALRSHRLCFFHNRLQPCMLRRAQAMRRRYMRLLETEEKVA
jgi:hypothetical protein